LQMVEMVLNKEHFQHVYTAKNAQEAIHLTKEITPDFIVLDVMLPDMNGFDLCMKLREYTEAHILFLTAKVTDFDILTGFEKGADDYVTKPFNPLEIVARIKAHLKRRNQLQLKETSHKKLHVFNDFSLDEDAGELVVQGKQINCPAQVYLLLLYFCKNVNRILTKEQLFEAVWGYDYMADDNTVMVHIRRIRERIEPNPSSPVHLITVRGLGYKLVKDTNV